MKSKMQTRVLLQTVLAVGLLAALTGGCKALQGGVLRAPTTGNAIPNAGPNAPEEEPPSEPPYAGAGPRPENVTSAIGTNHHFFDSWTAEWLFVDQFMKSRRWIPHGCSGAWDSGAALTLSDDGWVLNAPAGVCPGTILMDNPGYPSNATYVVLWEGEGTLSVEWDASGHAAGSASVTRSGDEFTSAGAGPHRATFHVNSANSGIHLVIRAFSRALPVRNIRVLMPGGVCGASPEALDPFRPCATARGGSGSCDAGQTCQDFEQVHFNRFADPLSTAQNPKVLFHPQSVSRMRGYRAHRFMDWMATNHSPVEHWSDRNLLTEQTFADDRGINYEVLVAFANFMGSDAWFCMPHRADNDFMTRFAELVRDGLQSSLKAYVEYSNEHWNGMFDVHDYARAQGEALGLGTEWTATSRFYSRRAVQMADLWASVFAGQSERIVRVFGGQSANLGVATGALDYNGASAHFDALAIAPYFGMAEGTDPTGMSLEQLFTHLRDVGIPDTMAGVSAHVSDAAARNLRVIAYEGGQHLWDARAEVLFRNANRDARMGQLYRDYFAAWKAAGGREFLHYVHVTSASGMDNWGALESPTQTTSPKFEAILDEIATPCAWPGCAR
ncbi:MAG: hypothetical protein IT285_04620 [Bdellovibrionales bacterium]|nr:hypothetical protein [Bdellovibrionales bacterium]